MTSLARFTILRSKMFIKRTPYRWILLTYVSHLLTYVSHLFMHMLSCKSKLNYVRLHKLKRLVCSVLASLEPCRDFIHSTRYFSVYHFINDFSRFWGELCNLPGCNRMPGSPPICAHTFDLNRRKRSE